MRAGIALVLTFGFGCAAQAQEVACPDRYASNDELSACIQDKNCKLGDAFPQEFERGDWVREQATAYLRQTLGNQFACVAVRDLEDGFKAQINECKFNEGAVGLMTAASEMARKDEIVTNRRGIGPRTEIGLASKFEDCS